MVIIMFSIRFSQLMAFPISSLLTDARYLPIKEKTPHLLMRIPAPSLPMPADNLELIWNQAVPHRRKAVWNA